MPDDRIGQIIEMAPGRQSVSWMARLQRNREGGNLPTIANVLIILANDSKLSGLLGFNSFTSQHLLLSPVPPAEDGQNELPGPYPRPWGIEDIALLQGYLQRVWSPKILRSTVEDAMVAAASTNRFHPVKDWLSSLAWDSKKRIDFWLTNTFDCPNDEYHQAVGAKFLIAAVRRIRSPGCKFDHMPVLEGAQGIGKSHAIKLLFSESWFSDDMPADLNSRDAALALLGIWCFEFAEIEHLIRAEVETIKAFLSRTVDRYRPPYGKAYVDRPRQGVLIGTTNKDDYLRDATGNRRIWPVRCKTVSLDYIRINRTQLWAEAAAREAMDEQIWLNDVAVRSVAQEVQTSRMEEDVWHELIETYVVGRKEVKIPIILSEVLSIPKDRQGKREQMRVAAILRSVGWQRVIGWQNRTTTRYWVPEPRPPDDPVIGQEEIRW